MSSIISRLLSQLPIPDIALKTISLAKALLSGEDVSPERLETRIRVCSKCPYVKILNETTVACNICSCKSTTDKALVNLARYEETEHYGCHYPGGSKWKEAGV